MRLQGIGCRVSQVDARLNVGLQQASQAPRAQSSAALTVVTPIPSLRRSDALKLLIAVRITDCPRVTQPSSVV